MKTMHTFRIMLILVILFVVLAITNPAYADRSFHYGFYEDIYPNFIAGDPYNPSPCSFDLVMQTYGPCALTVGWMKMDGLPMKQI